MIFKLKESQKTSPKFDVIHAALASNYCAIMAKTNVYESGTLLVNHC